MSGVYVIELAPGSIKVGRSGNVDKRLETHLRHARGHGLDPYRWDAFVVEPQLLVQAERECHQAITASGGTAAPHSPEVFSGVFYTPTRELVERTIADINDHAEALARLRALDPPALDMLLAGVPRDVNIVLRRALAVQL